MEPTYTAQRIEGTNAGWLVTDNETGEKTLVFCNSSANTEQGAIDTLLSSLMHEENE